ncbi:hypothetical protein BIW11_11878, partial [Tropilaelaps mercedesae]
RKVTITGDFNATSTVWGGKQTLSKGHCLQEWLAQMGLLLLNDGLVPTFVRRDQASFPDLTMAGQSIFRSITSWRVRVDKETLSDHRCITFNVVTNSDPPRKLKKARSWQARHLDVSVFKRVFRKECQGKQKIRRKTQSIIY